MNKLYDRIDFVNNTTPALNETNLNLMSKAVDDIDDRVIDIADDVLVVVPEILDKYADIEALATNPPYIGNNGHWWTWDTDLNQYVDSGVDAGVSVTVGTTTTLPAGSDATVTNSGTDTDPILNFGIPQGAAGQNGQDGADGQDGVSPEVIVASITGGHSVTITDADHPTGQTFNVMDGTNGQDGHGVPSGGTTGQVLKKASGTDYDTEWANESGGSGGHIILNGSGTSMTQRSKLQFDGASVTDDPANDKTIVTGTPQSMIGDAWASGQAYAVGDYRIDGNVLYKCKTAHTSSASNRPPYASYWDATPVASQLPTYDFKVLKRNSQNYMQFSVTRMGRMRLLTFNTVITLEEIINAVYADSEFWTKDMPSEDGSFWQSADMVAYPSISPITSPLISQLYVQKNLFEFGYLDSNNTWLAGKISGANKTITWSSGINKSAVIYGQMTYFV